MFFFFIYEFCPYICSVMLTEGVLIEIQSVNVHNFKDLYLWMSNIVNGPSMKFLVHNVHTMDELRMSGNCLKASRPILSFDAKFDTQPYLALIKCLIAQVRGYLMILSRC